jgi:hypothetical protein
VITGYSQENLNAAFPTVFGGFATHLAWWLKVGVGSFCCPITTLGLWLELVSYSPPPTPLDFGLGSSAHPTSVGYTALWTGP